MSHIERSRLAVFFALSSSCVGPENVTFCSQPLPYSIREGAYVLRCLAIYSRRRFHRRLLYRFSLGSFAQFAFYQPNTDVIIAKVESLWPKCDMTQNTYNAKPFAFRMFSLRTFEHLVPSLKACPIILRGCRCVHILAGSCVHTYFILSYSLSLRFALKFFAFNFFFFDVPRRKRRLAFALFAECLLFYLFYFLHSTTLLLHSFRLPQYATYTPSGRVT